MNPKAVRLYRKRALWQQGQTVIMVIFAGFLATLLFWLSNSAGIRDGVQYHRPFSPSQIQEPRLGATSSMSAACSKAGVRILKAGGNAADVMIATEFCVSVVGFELTGLGGGGFTLIRMPNDSYDALDFREEALTAATNDIFKNT